MENNKFIIKNENVPTTNEFQLSFDDFKSLSDNVEITSKIPYVDYLLLDGKNFEFPTKRFFVISLLVHSALLATALFYTLNPDLLPKTPQKEIITIDIEEDSSKGLSGAPAAMAAASLPEPTVPASAEPATVPEAAEPVMSAKAFIKPQVSKTTKAVKAVPAKSSPAKVSKSASKPAVKPTAASSSVKTFAANESVDDIALPALNDVVVADDSQNTAPNFEEIKNHLDEIDEQDNQKILAANQELNSLSSEQSQELDSASNELQSEESAIDRQAENRKDQLAKQRQSLLAAQAQAQAQAAENAKAAAAAKQAAKHQGSQHGNGLSVSGSGEGTGNSAGVSADGGSGLGDGNVRKLEDLKQMPGNQKPEYDNEERLKGLSGSIVLYGFVTKEGRLNEFKMIQSTGHRSLDRKTLVALKKWRFYPGQEGWVELPFKWDLKGGVQQKPTLLKRR